MSKINTQDMYSRTDMFLCNLWEYLYRCLIERRKLSHILLSTGGFYPLAYF